MRTDTITENSVSRADRLSYERNKRLFDVAVACLAGAALSPVIAACAVLVRLGGPGPVFYAAQRVGRRGHLFRMYKFRTMVDRPVQGSRITGPTDPRVHRTGAFLRRSKLDELPQLFNVIRGDMSLVGPRPEDPQIVAEHYTPVMRETLSVRPGLTSPGSLFGSTHGDGYLNPQDPEESYIEHLLALKLAMERVYIRDRSFGYDLRLIGRTLRLLARSAIGRTDFPDPPELRRAKELLARDAKP